MPAHTFIETVFLRFLDVTFFMRFDGHLSAISFGLTNNLFLGASGTGPISALAREIRQKLPKNVEAGARSVIARVVRLPASGRDQVIASSGLECQGNAVSAWLRDCTRIGRS